MVISIKLIHCCLSQIVSDHGEDGNFFWFRMCEKVSSSQPVQILRRVLRRMSKLVRREESSISMTDYDHGATRINNDRR
jgi:hypothetical protein